MSRESQSHWPEALEWVRRTPYRGSPAPCRMHRASIPNAHWCCDQVRLGTFCEQCGNPLSQCPAIDEPMVKSRRWIPYIAVSADEESLSLAAQQNQIRESFERARKAGHLLPDATLHSPFVEEHADGLLRLSERPAWQSLAATVTPGDTVVLASAARCIYSLRDFADNLRLLDRSGVGVKVLEMRLNTQSKFGRAMTSSLYAFADVQAQARSEVGRIVAKWQREHGRPSNQAPIGWRIVCQRGEKRLQADVQDRLVAELFAALHDIVGLPWRRIQRLTMRRGKMLPKPRGHKSRRGRPTSGDWAVPIIQRYARAARVNFPCPGIRAPQPVEPDRARRRGEHLLDQYLPTWRDIRDGRAKLKL
jgi:DNA invertase Pin-like site-specific DNA recombinase